MNLADARKKILELKPKRILLQFPEGLKDKTTELIKELEEYCEVIALMDPCFGACDADENLLNTLNADLLIHLGHLPISENKNILFIPFKYPFEEKKIKKLCKIMEKELIKRKINSIALGTTAQYIEWVPLIKKELEGKVKIFTAKGTGRIKEDAQLLGCNYSSLKIPSTHAEAIIYLGDGFFHPLGAVHAQEKPVFVLNPKEESIKLLEKEKNLFLRKRFIAIAKAKEAESFGIIISRKPGQKFLNKAIELKKKIELHGKKAFLLSVDYVNETYFIGTKIDCLVNTACPRIVIDDAENWKINIINSNELLIALGEIKWEDYAMDELA
ncbi:MAG: diphthamide biosynthesis enzyme Dph2 [Candidatus Diapherotrites archaeon]|nr:diphthamide biosynthesis enzyme Dph2 [Candidatus Diapherotrites archaeon]